MVDGEVRDSSEVAPEKTSAWTDEERERVSEPPAPPKLPEWAASFPAGETFTANGYECQTLHVGCEDGHWLILMRPVRQLGTFTPKSRAASRAEYRGLVRTLGKKKAKARIKERARAANAASEEA